MMRFSRMTFPVVLVVFVTIIAGASASAGKSARSSDGAPRPKAAKGREAPRAATDGAPGAQGGIPGAAPSSPVDLSKFDNATERRVRLFRVENFEPDIPTREDLGQTGPVRQQTPTARVSRPEAGNWTVLSTQRQDNPCDEWVDDEPQTRWRPNNVNIPWEGVNRKNCRLFTTYTDRFGNEANYVCSGSMIGDGLLLTARHCTYDGCLGSATEIYVACGYGFATASESFSASRSDLAHFGLARVTSCTRYRQFDEQTSCIDGEETVGPFEYDIQVCELDRATAALGYYGFTTSEPAILDVTGYPGFFRGLDDNFPDVNHKQFEFTHAVDFEYSSALDIRLSNSYLLGGQSGSPFHFDDSVYGVYDGIYFFRCSNSARRIDDVFYDALIDARQAPGPPPACPVKLYARDVFDFGPDSRRGIKESGTSTFESLVSIPRGASIDASVPLYNVGVADATVTVRIVRSSSTSSIGGGTVVAQETYVVDSNTISFIEIPFEINFVGRQAIWATWAVTSSCGPVNYDDDVEYLGTVSASSGGGEPGTSSCGGARLAGVKSTLLVKRFSIGKLKVKNKTPSLSSSISIQFTAPRKAIVSQTRLAIFTTDQGTLEASEIGNLQANSKRKTLRSIPTSSIASTTNCCDRTIYVYLWAQICVAQKCDSLPATKVTQNLQCI